MSQPTATNPAPNYVQVDPNVLGLPVNESDVPRFYTDLKNILIAINHNLQEFMAVTTADLATAGTNQQALDQSVSALESNMNRVMATIPTLAGHTGGASTRAPKLSSPAKFDGSDKNKAVSFRVAVTHYLRTLYPNATADKQVAFIISCLEGKAHDWLEPSLEQDVVQNTPVPWLHDVGQFWVQFNALWNVANKTENFRAKFKALKQTKSVQEYHKDFQMYGQNLGYNDVSMRDFFYDGLTVKIKEMLMAQDFDHAADTVTLSILADKALKIDQRLEQFQAQTKSSGSSSNAGPSGSKSSTSPSAAAPTGTAREKLSVGEKVYTIVDGKARKGTIAAISKNSKGKNVPTIKWNDGSSEETTFNTIKKDSHPIVVASPAPQLAKGSGPGPMDLDSVGKGKKPIICNTCGGKGHYASACPSKPYSGQGAEISEEESENEDL
ncbi:Transposon Tf2-12 polyprotein [Ceratobasidium sp. AG-Ba]|nr:Transposon Tf2-12 polyprotein [Ceratobasidium sp. AG-Ba]